MADNNTANSTAVESLIQRDKVITIIAIAVLVGATLTYTVLGVGMNMSAIQLLEHTGNDEACCDCEMPCPTCFCHCCFCGCPYVIMTPPLLRGVSRRNRLSIGFGLA